LRGIYCRQVSLLAMVKVKVNFYGSLVGQVGMRCTDYTVEASSEGKESDEGPRMSHVVNALMVTFPILKEMIRNNQLSLSLNNQYVQGNDLVHENDEIGLLPPISGG
jgi:molybdopterin converting factor small subunit